MCSCFEQFIIDLIGPISERFHDSSKLGFCTFLLISSKSKEMCQKLGKYDKVCQNVTSTRKRCSTNILFHFFGPAFFAFFEPAFLSVFGLAFWACFLGLLFGGSFGPDFWCVFWTCFLARLLGLLFGAFFGPAFSRIFLVCGTKSVAIFFRGVCV